MLSTSQTQDQLVTVHTLARQPTSSRVRYNGGVSKGLGVMIIIGGITAIILGGLLMWVCSLAGVLGAGVWGGILYVIAGSLGYCAGAYKTKGYIQSFLVMSIIALIVGCGVIAVSAVALALSDSTGTYYCTGYSGFSTRSKVMECLLLITGILMLLTLSWALSITCNVVCCGKMVMEQPQSESEVKYTEPKSVILTTSTPASPAEKSAQAYEDNMTKFRYPSPQEMSQDSQYQSQYSQQDTSHGAPYTPNYSQEAQQYPQQYNQPAPQQPLQYQQPYQPQHQPVYSLDDSQTSNTHYLPNESSTDGPIGRQYSQPYVAAAPNTPQNVPYPMQPQQQQYGRQQQNFY